MSIDDARLVFLLIYAMGFAYTVFKQRQADVLTIAFLASALYFLPGVFGVVLNLDVASFDPKPIDSATAYNVFSLVLGSILLVMIFSDCVGSTRHLSQTPSAEAFTDGHSLYVNVTISYALVVSAAFAVLELDQILAVGKPEFGRIHQIFQIMVGVALTVCVTSRQYAWALIFLAFMFVDVYAGNREGLAMPVTAILLLKLREYGINRVVARWAAVLPVCLAAGFLIAYKTVYAAIKSGNKDVVLERITDPDFFVLALTYSEPFLTQAILNDTISADLRFSAADWLLPVVYSFGVFTPQLGAEIYTFSEFFSGSLYPGLGFGVASNAWAEAFAVGGLLVVLLTSLLFALTGVVYSKALQHFRGQPVLSALIAISSANLFFFIHRTGVAYQVVIQKRIVIAAVLIWLTVLLLRMVGRTMRKAARETPS